jgi:hypothetical protein
MSAKTSTIRIGRYHNTSSSSVTSKSKVPTNLFALLDDLPSEDEIVTTNKDKDDKDYYLGIPPFHQIDWKKGILNGKSWADEVGA